MLEKLAKKYYCIDLVFIIQVILTFFNDDSNIAFAFTLLCILLVLFEIYLILRYEKGTRKQRTGITGCLVLTLLLGVLLWYR
ncbi:hypothetical protein [Anaerostipes sp.]|uniref:hypothetical protein n=1 Tax=Anaerostipes sp. TaxID=1872530 RepID=UPI0025BAA8EA|nr:hypothetical protein [Anaerostipes sp.]MBS7009899.1 hypothetical protein [Anaerostipes sp.]